MAFQQLIANLRRTERDLLKQLSGVREAISSLEMGGAVSPAMPAQFAKSTETKKKTRISTAGRARIAAAQKARWAKVKAGKKR